MPLYTPKNSEAFVYVYKEGVLSAVAHDLQLRVTNFEISESADGEETLIVAQLDASSLRVVCAMRQGVPDESALSERGKREIEKNIVASVLQASRFPNVAATMKLKHGQTREAFVQLCGVRKAIAVALVSSNNERIARVRLHQPDFGIKPYSALLGALRVKAHIDIEIRVPHTGEQ